MILKYWRDILRVITAFFLGTIAMGMYAFVWSDSLPLATKIVMTSFATFGALGWFAGVVLVWLSVLALGVGGTKILLKVLKEGEGA